MTSVNYCALALSVLAAASACAIQQPQSFVHVDPLIVDAMLAQVEGGGGCIRIEETAQTTSPFFPSVRFVTGRCLNEHAEVLRSTVAVDGSGVIYSLRTEEGLRFLTRRHTPVGLTRESIGSFSKWALEVLDELPSTCHVPAENYALSLSASEPDRLWSEFGDVVVDLTVTCGEEEFRREVHITSDGLVDVL